MTNIEELNLFDEIVAKERELLKSKCSDYNTSEDALQNFKFAATFAKTSPEIVLRVILGIKIARLMNLWDKNPIHEPIEETIGDLRNYLFLKEAVTVDTAKDTQLKIQFQ